MVAVMLAHTDRSMLIDMQLVVLIIAMFFVRFKRTSESFCSWHKSAWNTPIFSCALVAKAEFEHGWTTIHCSVLMIQNISNIKLAHLALRGTKSLQREVDSHYSHMSNVKSHAWSSAKTSRHRVPKDLLPLLADANAQKKWFHYK